MKDTMSLSDMQTYRGRQEVPEDFDQFWQEAIQSLPTLSDYTIEEQEFNTPNLRCFDLYFDGSNHGKIYARCVFPKNKKNIPVIFHFHGYMGQNPDWSVLFAYAAMGYGIVAMDVRGQSGRSLDNAVFNGNTVKGQIIRGMIDGPNSLFYKDVYLDTYRLIEIVADFEDVDSQNLSSFGGSQGGALALVAAALNHKIKKCVTIYPFLGDFKRVLELGNHSEAYDELFRYFKFHDPFHTTEDKILKTLSYIDVKNFSHLIECPVKFVTCLDDNVCFPSTQYAIYNRIQSEKEHFLLPEYGHDAVNVHLNDMVANWLMETTIDFKL
ncbi:acetylxylan esterase [Streptococcus halotolerans]|uniref:acetylxylan esterase n=1 Tax=Streptococcus halotolerans TaxID=1814128 RepID=UPI0007895C7F|nr:acetylxylan esterase [Streptococcus halotolerans]